MEVDDSMAGAANVSPGCEALVIDCYRLAILEPHCRSDLSRGELLCNNR